MQSHAAENDKIRRLQRAEAEPEASANHSSASGSFQWIVGNKQDDFKNKHVMQKVRQTAMGSYLKGARSQSDAAVPVGKESFNQKLTRNGSAHQPLSSGVEFECATHGIDDDTEELMKQKIVYNKYLKVSTAHERFYSPLSTSARVNLLDFMLLFVGKMYKTSGYQTWGHNVRISRSAASIEKHFMDFLEVYVTQLMTVSTAALNASAGANEKDATLTFFGAVLVQHYKVPIARLLSVWKSGSRTSDVEFVIDSPQEMPPPDFSPERYGLKTKPMITVENDCGGYSYIAGKLVPSLICLIELSHYLERTTTGAELGVIVDMLVSTDEVRFLALCLRFCLSQENCSAIQLIDATMAVDNLFHMGSASFNAEIQVHWSITKFMRDQYGDQYGADIPQFGSVVALTGRSTRQAQASTCADYIMSTWPLTGPFFLELLDAIHAAFFAADTQRRVRVFSRAYPGFSVQADVDLDISPDTLTVFEVRAMNYHLLRHVAQLLSWLSSAFTTSPFQDQLAYSTPLFTRKSQGVFFISTKHEPVNESEQTCWLNLFDRACIAAGFPISDRAEEIGLEISLDLLAGLSGARHIFEYKGGLVMKGFSHMFVPIRRQLDRVQWHAVSSPDEDTPLSYQDGISHYVFRAMLDEVGLQDLTSLRAIVGWCSVATTCLGSSHADYENIDYTKADEANSGLRCTGGSLGFQQFGVAALDVKFGLKDGKSHFQRSGPYQKIIRFAEGSPIVLHDVERKQSWLVPATNVMLHIVQHRHRLDPFQENGTPISLDTNIVTGSSAKQVLLENRNRVLFGDDKHTFMDEILDIWSILEFLLAQNVARQRETPGVRIPSSVHESLYGFEFNAVVHQDALFKLKKTNISRNHGGWSKLIEDIDALVLFANGFGDVILPAGASNQDLCPKWRRVPHGQDYLATTTNMLQTLFDKAGSRVDQKYLTTKSKLRWHQGSSALFDKCRDVTICDCTRLQQLVPESAIKSAQPPTSIADKGAVIFGNPEPRSAPLRSTVSKISSSLYSQPNIPILPRIVRRRSSSNDECKGKIRRLDIEAEELSCEQNHRPQAMS